MPNVESAKKRVKTNEKRRLRNRAARSTLKSGLKRLEVVLASNDPQAIETTARKTLSLIGKTGKKNAIHPKKASRLQSRIQRRINKAVVATSSETSS